MPTDGECFDASLEGLDDSLFEAIPSQTSANDRRSLLACQFGIRTLIGDYTYLEVGSYLGGSIQPHLVDPKCRCIYAIDKRSSELYADERGVDFRYRSNSSLRMLQNLSEVSASEVKKVTCIDSDASEVRPETINPRPHLCLVDGQHTDSAVWSDFCFCTRVIERSGAIVFHDAEVVYNGLQRIVDHLTAQNLVFRAYHLPDYMFVIEFNELKLHDTRPIRQMLIDNHVGYLASLRYNDHYRVWMNKPIVRHLRNLKARLHGAHISD